MYFNVKTRMHASWVIAEDSTRLLEQHRDDSHNTQLNTKYTSIKHVTGWSLNAEQGCFVTINSKRIRNVILMLLTFKLLQTS